MSIVNGVPTPMSWIDVAADRIVQDLLNSYAQLPPMGFGATISELRIAENLDPSPEPKLQAPGFVGPRGTYKVKDLNTDWQSIPEGEEEYGVPVEYADANLVGSKTALEEDGHLPVIDLDLPCHLEPSTKPDHYHLYINKVVKWDDYVKLLDAMLACGLINEGFHVMSIRRGQTYVRRPGVLKNPGEADS